MNRLPATLGQASPPGSRVPLLEIDRLRVEVTDRRPFLPLIHDVSLTILRGESVGLVGESGSGKSMTIKSAMRLLPRAVKPSGTVSFEGRPVLRFSRKDLARYRAAEVSVIHQDPRAHTNPLRTIGDFLVEGLVSTGRSGRREAAERACALLAEMGIGDARRRLGQYPHQLSGGLLQRVMIAAALL